MRQRIVILDASSAAAAVKSITALSTNADESEIRTYETLQDLRPHIHSAEILMLNLDAVRRRDTFDPTVVLALCPPALGVIGYGFDPSTPLQQSRTGELSESIVVLRLPCTTADLRAVFVEANMRISGAGLAKQTALRRRLLGKRVSDMDRRQRHDFRNGRAAIRLLHGAARSGDFDLGAESEDRRKFCEAYSAVAQSDDGWRSRSIDFAADFDIELVQTEIGMSPPQGSRREWKEFLGRVRRIVVVEDEAAIWIPTLGFIFGWERTVVVDSDDKVLPALSQVMPKEDGNGETDSQGVDFVILDVDLGQGRRNGVELLADIKGRYEDLPVLIFTASDDAAVTKECLRRGASGYFVKELADPDDRDSAAYYQKFKESLVGLPLWDDRRRLLWRRFSSIENTLDQLDRQHGSETASSLRRAFFYLFAEPAEIFVVRLLLPLGQGRREPKSRSASDLLGMSAFSCERAIHELLVLTLMNKGWSRDLAMAFLNKKEGDKYPSLGQTIERVFPQPSVKIISGRLSRLATAVRHAGNQRSTPSQRLDDALESADAVITLVQFWFADARIEAHSRRSWPSIPFLLPVVNPEQYATPHYIPSMSAARRLWEGFRSAVGGRVPPFENRATYTPPQSRSRHAIFIDDEGDGSPWSQVLKGVLGHKGYHVTVTDNYSTKLKLNKYDFVLLDWIHEGKLEAGLTILKEIRQQDLAIPILVLTVENSSRSIRKAFEAGASDYFVKQHEDLLPREQYYAAFVSAIAECMKFDSNSLPRRLWHAVSELERPIRRDRPARVWKIWKLKYSKLGIDKKQVGSFLRATHSGYLRAAYFYYLLAASVGVVVDAHRKERLLLGARGSRASTDEVILNCGKSIELLVRDLELFQYGKPSHNDTGYLMWLLIAPLKTKILWDHIWRLRNRAKMGDSSLGSAEAADILTETAQAVDHFRFWKGAAEIHEDDDRFAVMLRSQFEKAKAGTVIESNTPGLVKVQFDEPSWLWAYASRTTSVRPGTRHEFVLDHLDPSKGIFVVPGPGRLALR